MKITKEIIEAILERREQGLTYGEISRHINMTSQNVGRFMSGHVRSINDASGDALLELLGMKEPPPSTAGHLFEIVCTSACMEPTVAKGQKLLARCTHYNDINSGDLVVASFSDESKEERTVLRYFHRHRQTVDLKSQSKAGLDFKTTTGRLNWVAKVFFITRSLEVR